MLNFFKQRDVSEVMSPVNGTVFPISECRDLAFSSGAMGPGVFFQYDGNFVVAPCCGTVEVLASTGHCVGIRCDNGAEILIHVGFDTMMLGGKGLKIMVSKNQRVRTGQKLIKIDRAYMEEKKIDLATPMVVTNPEDIELEIECNSGRVDTSKTVIMRCKLKAEE